VRALPDWSAVPSNSEEDRLFLNRRLAYFGLVIFLISGGFYAFNILLAWIFVPEMRTPRHLLHLGVMFHLLATCISLGQWLACRRGRRSSVELNLIDVGGLLLSMVMYAVMASTGGGGLQQTLTLLLITLAIVVTHAIIVPGTARRTLWISYAACVPTIFGAWYLAMNGPSPAPWMPWMNILYSAMWCVVTVALSTLASRIIYGLQQKVREATQLGQYTLQEKIGEGGMGMVYLARHALLRRPTAVKLLPRARAGEQNVRRFEREVQLTSSLTHPNTIAIYDYGHTPDGVFYYAMEHLEGITLEDLVEHDGPQPAGRVVHVLEQACSALAEAHGIGLIHRDIKPANLMLCVRGGLRDQLKVLDFGLVKEIDRGDSPELSTAAVLVGTPLYLAPEAITAPDRIDARADLYALGCVAYYLLAGVTVFEGATVLEVCGKHLHAVPEPPSTRSGRTIPPSLEALVLRLLSKDPDERPASASEILDLLRSLEGIEPWKSADAKRWWEERAPEIRERVRASHTQKKSSDPRTFTIDLEHREARADSDTHA